MKKLNKNMNIHFRLKWLTGLLAIGFFVISNIKAEEVNEKVSKVKARLQTKAITMEKSVQSSFNPDQWQLRSQLALSTDLTPTEIIERMEDQLKNLGLVETQPALASIASKDSVKSITKRIERIAQSINNRAIKLQIRGNAGALSQLKGKLLKRAELPVANFNAELDFQAPSREEQDKHLGFEFLNTYKSLLRIDNPDSEFKLTRRQEDELRRCHLRYSQFYHGLSVWPAELIVHLDPEGDVDLMSGAYIPTPSKIVTKPSLGIDEAIDVATKVVPGSVNVDVLEPKLIIYAPLERTPRLAWKMEVEVSLYSRWLVVVDAHNGTTLDAYEQVMDNNVRGSGKDLFGISRSLNVWQKNSFFYLVDTSKPMFDLSSTPPQSSSTNGGIIVLDARNGGSGGKLPDTLFHVASQHSDHGWLPDAVSAAYGLSETYDYFLERHNRNSWDGKGSSIIGIVRVGAGLKNALWNGSYMLFGDGRPFARAIDVVAHELTHGVTHASGDLLYQNQSGALNEAFSDIFGEMVEARTKGGPDWLAGADSGKTSRNYKQPSQVDCLPNTPCPSKMSDYIDTLLDNGGVHVNSNIISHAFYLLAEGLPGAIGLRDAEKIFYRTLTTKLLQQSQFVDARNGAIASAEELFGENSIQASKTAEAFNRVEIFDNVQTPSPTPIPAINAPDSTMMVSFDKTTQAYYLGRREPGFSDPSHGVRLNAVKVKPRRPSITGDGRLMVFVNLDNDVCIYKTDNSQKGECLDVLSGQIHSVAMSPDGRHYAVILLNEQGKPDNKIALINLDGAPQIIDLKAPLLDGGKISILRADVMDFSLNGTSLIYDAFNQIQFEDGSQIGLWSIYMLDLKTGIISVVEPPTLETELGNPTFSQRHDHIVTFEIVPDNSISSLIATKNLFSGEVDIVRVINGPPYKVKPVFTGDDSAIVYSAPAQNSTGFSLFRQPLSDNLISPQGEPSLWFANASLGVIYRRGDFNQQEKFRLNISLTGNGSGLVSSSPSGIICGNDCSEKYTKGTKVSLVANPVSENTVFLGWNGDCSGTGVCKISIDTNKSVTAEFSTQDNPPHDDLFQNTRLFAIQQYRDFFHREGNAGGIEYWRKLIDDGILSRSQVINEFLSSAEFSGRVSPIVRLYFAYFLRIPDFQGLNYWLDAFRNGMSLPAISEAFEQSDEFNITYGNLSDAEFVTLVYQNVLQREPDAAGLNYWIGQLANGKSRGEIMIGFSESAEYQSKIANSVVVTMIYAGMLQRSPDQGGFNTWKEQFDNGTSPVGVIEGFLNSTEYHNRFSS